MLVLMHRLIGNNHTDELAQAGSSIAVRGPNGAGKSTLIDLLMRFRVRGTGNISINSTDINTVATDSLRTVQTLSSQDIFIFDSTLRDNIAVADPDASENRIMQAAHYAWMILLTSCRTAWIHSSAATARSCLTGSASV